MRAMRGPVAQSLGIWAAGGWAGGALSEEFLGEMRVAGAVRHWHGDCLVSSGQRRPPSENCPSRLPADSNGTALLQESRGVAQAPHPWRSRRLCVPTRPFQQQTEHGADVLPRAF